MRYLIAGLVSVLVGAILSGLLILLFFNDPYWQGQPLASYHTGQGPEFPEEMDGWKLTEQWDGTVRVFGGGWFAASGPVDSFPHTQNGCDNHMFLIRWRAVGSEELYSSSGYVYRDAIRPDGRIVRPVSSGWMELSGCEAPMWRLKGEASELADVVYSVQEWWAAA